MNIYTCFFILCLSLVGQLIAAPRTPPVYYDNQSSVAIKETRDVVDNMRHVIQNHESEIRAFDAKLDNLDTIIESVRDQISEMNQTHKEQLKGSSTSLDTKIIALESITKSLVGDLKQIKSHVNDFSAILVQNKQKIVEIEQIVEQQNKNLDYLQSAIVALTDALQVKPSVATQIKTPLVPKTNTERMPSENPGNTYKIKEGDSLVKIAKINQTTVQAIKDLNHLTTDKIVVGRVLQIPEK